MAVVPLIKVKVAVVKLEASIGMENVTVIGALIPTPVAPLAMLAEVTDGG